MGLRKLLFVLKIIRFGYEDEAEIHESVKDGDTIQLLIPVGYGQGN